MIVLIKKSSFATIGNETSASVVVSKETKTEPIRTHREPKGNLFVFIVRESGRLEIYLIANPKSDDDDDFDDYDYQDGNNNNNRNQHYLIMQLNFVQI